MTEADRFARLYRQYSLKIFRFALHMSGSTATAEEVTQETFVMLMDHPKRFDPARGEIGPFLFGVARNLVHRHLERGRKFEGMEDTAEERFSSGEDILRDLTQRENVQALRDAILVLPAKYREAVVLCDLHEMSYEEAAVVMECPVGTVRSRLNRARSMLLARLQARCLV
jgi:RNA polymerase sigma-70 factor (ECF subfamily)